MASPYAKFKTDSEMETSGIWLDYGDFKIRIARAGGANVRYEQALAKHVQKNKLAVKTESLSTNDIRKILIEVFADTVILGWEGLTDENEQLMPFSRENAIKVLTDLPELFADIQEQSSKIVLFQRKTLEEAAKNS